MYACQWKFKVKAITKVKLMSVFKDKRPIDMFVSHLEAIRPFFLRFFKLDIRL